VWTEALLEAGAVGAIVWVDGEAQAAGFAKLEAGEPMTPEHRIRVGSIDKIFMAVVALEVFDDLDVPAARWLPELDADITLRDLLSHRSGLFNWVLDGETYERLCFRDRALGPPEELLRVALRYPRRNVGEVTYSNTNYTALQLTIESATGEPLGELIRRRVIEPYGLSHTTFDEDLELPEGVAHGYALKAGTFPVPGEGPRDVSDYWTDGSIASTAADLGSLFRQLDPELPALRDYGYAIGHGGTMPGYTTLVLDGARLVVIAVNSHSLPVTRAVHALGRDLVLAQDVVQ
jgi:D-alanyl-D-alanine carboxypeptidase